VRCPGPEGQTAGRCPDGEPTHGAGETVTTTEKHSLSVAESIAGVDLDAEPREYDPERGSAVVFGLGSLVVRPEVAGSLARQWTPIGVFVDPFAFELEHPHQRPYGGHVDDRAKSAHHGMRRNGERSRRNTHR
jgi:hypothetical protein